MLSLKQIGTICLSILIPTFSVFATPDIASNSNGNGSCVEPVLHRYDGSANLQAGWQANTIQLKWYNGDTQLDVQDAADSCTYDGALTLPSTQPTKTGYTFAGWRVKTGSAAASNSCFVGPVCGLTSALVSSEIEHFWAKGMGYDGNPVCFYDDDHPTDCSSDSTFNSMNTHEWLVQFSHGMVKGTAGFNDTPPSAFFTAMEGWQNGTMTEEQEMAVMYGGCESDAIQPAGTFSSSSTGQYCWCHAESYTPNGGSSCNLSSLSWVFATASADEGACASVCAIYMYDTEPFRAAMFGVAGN